MSKNTTPNESQAPRWNADGRHICLNGNNLAICPIHDDAGGKVAARALARSMADRLNQCDDLVVAVKALLKAQPTYFDSPEAARENVDAAKLAHKALGLRYQTQ